MVRGRGRVVMETSSEEDGFIDDGNDDESNSAVEDDVSGSDVREPDVSKRRKVNRVIYNIEKGKPEWATTQDNEFYYLPGGEPTRKKNAEFVFSPSAQKWVKEHGFESRPATGEQVRLGSDTWSMPLTAEQVRKRQCTVAFLQERAVVAATPAMQLKNDELQAKVAALEKRLADAEEGLIVH
jgi:hypothetical protein